MTLKEKNWWQYLIVQLTKNKTKTPQKTLYLYPPLTPSLNWSAHSLLFTCFPAIKLTWEPLPDKDDLLSGPSDLIPPGFSRSSLLQWPIFPEMPTSTTSRNHIYPQEPTLSVFQTKPKKGKQPPNLSWPISPRSYLLTFSERHWNFVYTCSLHFLTVFHSPYS